jgi:hypothetical protein
VKWAKRIALFFLLGIVAFLLIFIGFSVRNHERVNLLLTYGPIGQPTFDAYPGCTWIRRTFSKKGISFFQQDCPSPPYANDEFYFEDNAGRIDRGFADDPNSQVRAYAQLELFTKAKSEAPYDVVKKEYYDKLTPDEQQNCEIRDADHPLEFFKAGENKDQPENEAEPNPTPHKIRYEIALKPSVFQMIIDKNNGGDPGSGAGYDYLCGNVVGSQFDSFPPYFEFDDRSPDKYLFVHSYGLEFDEMIDLDSIIF